MEPIGAGTAATKATLSAVRIGDTTKRNNRLALREYEDLARWARDVLQEEASELNGAEERARERRIAGPGLGQQELGRVRDVFAQRWRDRKSASDRALEDLHDSENVLHRTWRKARRRPWPENPYEEELRTISQGWEQRAR